MATIPTEIEMTSAPRNTRLNEIIAIGMIALALLLGLCLASYNPNDPSWNTAGETATHNWIGAVGANVATVLFQAIGLAAYLLPLLLLATAWRRFRSRRIKAPLSRAAGLLLFAQFYERIAFALANRFAGLRSLPERFRAWRHARRAARQKLRETRRLAKAEAVHASDIKAAEVEFAGVQTEAGSTEIRSADGDVAEAFASFTAATASGQRSMTAAAGAATAPARKSSWSARGKSLEASETAVVQEMIREAAVKRKTEAPASGALPFDGRRISPKTAASDYQLPSVNLLNEAQMRREQADDELLNMATKLAEKCREFNVTGQIKYICPGPVVTTYEFKPDPGVKYSRVTSLVDDLCLALKAESIRIDRMPGKPHVGIEVPNPRRETIYLREVIESRAFKESTSKLTIALGKTIDGLNYVTDLTKMPHLLIAGTTGSGKSVGVNSLLVSILYRARPDEVKVILIDPKRLELGLYEDIPHLATPIIVDPKPAARALRWAVGEMERRYKELAGWGVRNIDGYNAERERRNTVKDFDENGEPWTRMPYIVIIIDELADLMMTSGHEVEDSITRLAQMARAVGIHLVLATQRPSVDVITGLIKANFPSRISYRVSSKVDSRTILDTNGAEHLLGKGDMLFLPPGSSRLLRVHGAYVDESEINKVVSHIKAQWEPDYDETITQSDEEAMGLEDSGGERDELFEDALRIVVDMKRASTSVLQRRLRIGYGRAAAVLDQMEREGLIGQADGARPRPVLARAFELVAEWDEQEVV